MLASDLVKMKQNGLLYKSYYKPHVFESTIFSTVYPVSYISSGGAINSTFGSTIFDAITYSCNPTIISYNMANDISRGSYVCGHMVEYNDKLVHSDKIPSRLLWVPNMNAPPFLTYTSTQSSVSSVASYIPQIKVCAPVISFYQEPSIEYDCCGCSCQN